MKEVDNSRYCSDLADSFGKFISAKAELPRTVLAESDFVIIIQEIGVEFFFIFIFFQQGSYGALIYVAI